MDMFFEYGRVPLKGLLTRHRCLIPFETFCPIPFERFCLIPFRRQISRGMSQGYGTRYGTPMACERPPITRMSYSLFGARPYIYIYIHITHDKLDMTRYDSMILYYIVAYAHDVVCSIVQYNIT